MFLGAYMYVGNMLGYQGHIIELCSILVLGSVSQSQFPGASAKGPLSVTCNASQHCTLPHSHVSESFP